MDPLNQFLAWVLQAVRSAVTPVAIIALLCAAGMCLVSNYRGGAKVAGTTVVVWLMLHVDTYFGFLQSH
jgi:hypothetical protein